MIKTLFVNKTGLENLWKFTQIYIKLYEWAALLQNATSEK